MDAALSEDQKGYRCFTVRGRYSDENGVEPPPFALKWLLIIGVVVVLFATGVIHFEFFYSTSTSAPAASAGAAAQMSSPIGAPPASSRLGTGVRTAAAVRWLRRMKALCASRNRRENAISGPESTTDALTRYAAQTLWVWDEYQRRATMLPTPASYAAEAGWLQQADTATRAAISNIFEAARSDDKQASHAAIFGFQNLSSTTYPTFVRIGLAACGRFHP